MGTLIIALSVASGIVQIFGYWIYNRDTFSGKIQPNATSWFMWAVGSALATWSYMALSEDWVKDILPITCSIVCMLTFVFALLRGKYKPPDMYDVFVCSLDMGIIIFWLLTESDEYTNLLFQIDVMLSFVPIVKNTWKNPDHEQAKPWLIWSTSYAMMTVVVMCRYEKWWDLMYPLNYLALHVLIAAIVIYKKRKV